MDLFAPQDNRLLDQFASWRLDLSAITVDAFMFPLKGENPYSFPPSLAFLSCSERCFTSKRRSLWLPLIGRGMAVKPQPDTNRALPPVPD